MPISPLRLKSTLLDSTRVSKEISGIRRPDKTAEHAANLCSRMVAWSMSLNSLDYGLFWVDQLVELLDMLRPRMIHRPRSPSSGLTWEGQAPVRSNLKDKSKLQMYLDTLGGMNMCLKLQLPGSRFRVRNLISIPLQPAEDLDSFGGMGSS